MRETAACCGAVPSAARAGCRVDRFGHSTLYCFVPGATDAIRLEWGREAESSSLVVTSFKPECDFRPVNLCRKHQCESGDDPSKRAEPAASSTKTGQDQKQKQKKHRHCFARRKGITFHRRWSQTYSGLGESRWIPHCFVCKCMGRRSRYSQFIALEGRDLAV